MDWNEAAENLLHQILSQTPRPVRDATESQLRAMADSLADDEGKQRVNVEIVIAAWIRITPETLRPDLLRQMERVGLDPDDYRALFE